MATRYYQLGPDELKLEHAKQQEIVNASTADEYLDEWHKLSVIESLIAWHAAEAFRSGGVKQKATQSKGKKSTGRSKARKPSSWSQINIRGAGR
jgi:hypothetical protein